MASPARNDPYSALNFLVEIDGIAVAGFTECFGLSTETDVIEYREGGEPTRSRKIPGLTRYAPIVLKRGITKNRDLWKWRKTVIDGRISRRSVSIVLLDEEHKEVARWNVVNAWPSKWEGPHLNAKSSEVAIETLELVYEGLDFA
jgi:phage tail-like protein